MTGSAMRLLDLNNLNVPNEDGTRVPYLVLPKRPLRDMSKTITNGVVRGKRSDGV